MSGTQQGGGADPSMEDILASIRRILNEEEPAPPARAEPHAAPAAPVAAAPLAAAPGSDVFALDASMLVPAHDELPALPALPPPLPVPEPPPPIAEPLAMFRPSDPEPAVPPPPSHVPSPIPEPETLPPSWPAALVAPEAAAAAASSVGSLRRTLEAGRASMLVRHGGPTLDEIVREELRPVLKAWLDAHLPEMVERLVRAEIERVVGRADL